MVLALLGMGCTAHSDSLDVLQLLKLLSSAMVTLDDELLRGPAGDCLQRFIRHHAMRQVVHNRCLARQHWMLESTIMSFHVLTAAHLRVVSDTVDSWAQSSIYALKPF
jgi:hypothetical protein